MKNPLLDLYEEHGFVDRVIQLYEKWLLYLVDGKNVNPKPIHEVALVVQEYIEHHHEKLEEMFIFPILKSTHNAFISLLIHQHMESRMLTKQILDLTRPDWFVPGKVAFLLQTFIKLYRAHMAQENSIIFPTVNKVLSNKQIKDLQDSFEKVEKNLTPAWVKLESWENSWLGA